MSIFPQVSHHRAAFFYICCAVHTFIYKKKQKNPIYTQEFVTVHVSVHVVDCRIIGLTQSRDLYDWFFLSMISASPKVVRVSQTFTHYVRGRGVLQYVWCMVPF